MNNDFAEIKKVARQMSARAAAHADTDLEAQALTLERATEWKEMIGCKSVINSVRDWLGTFKE